ncbi:hypothetical protein BLAT2472_20417 [Burkholderia latens]
MGNILFEKSAVTKVPLNKAKGVFDNTRIIFEPPRILWRLQLLREWSHEQEGNQVFAGSPGARRASGARAA